MAPRSGAVPLMAVSDREQELRRAEQEAAGLESQLVPEITRLDSTTQQVLARFQQVKAAANQLELLGSVDPAFADVQHRLRQVAIPVLDVAHHHERALQARAQAVSARLDSAEAMRRTIEVFASELSRFSTQLSADEATLQRCHKLVQEEIARRAAEEERRAAPPPPPPPAKPPPVKVSLRMRMTPPGTRGGPRVRMQAAIDFHSDSNFYTGFSTNISEGGIFVATVSTPARGSQVELHFTLPGGMRVDVRGEVRWSREVNDNTPEIFPGVGVQFIDLSENAHTAIKKFIEQREPMFFPD